MFQPFAGGCHREQPRATGITTIADRCGRGLNHSRREPAVHAAGFAAPGVGTAVHMPLSVAPRWSRTAALLAADHRSANAARFQNRFPPKETVVDSFASP